MAEPTEPKFRGMYIETAIERVRAKAGDTVTADLIAKSGLPPSVKTMREYPMRHLARFVYLAAETVWPEEAVEVVIEKFGRASFGAFAQSLIGKVGLNLALGTPTKMGESIVSMHNASTRASKCELIGSDEGSFRLRISGAVNPHWQLGLFRVALEDSGMGRVSLENVVKFDLDEDKLPDAEFDVLVVMKAAGSLG